MQVLDSFLDAMGDTPLVRLRAGTRGLRPTVLAKLEMLNPTGSVAGPICLRSLKNTAESQTFVPAASVSGKTMSTLVRELVPEASAAASCSSPVWVASVSIVCAH